MTDYRAVFDAEVSFRHGGSLQTQRFRLDVPTAEVTDDQLADLLIADLGLTMVDQVQISGVRVVARRMRARAIRPRPLPRGCQPGSWTSAT
jgi:hypothetical protein